MKLFTSALLIILISIAFPVIFRFINSLSHFALDMDPFAETFDLYGKMKLTKPDLNSSLYLKSEQFDTIISSFIDSEDIHFEGSNQLKERINDSVLIIDQLLSTYDINTEIALSFNGGKDCMVMVILFISRLHKKIPLNNELWKRNKLNSVLIDYEKQFPEVISFIRESSHDYNLDLIQINDTLKSGFKQYLDRNTSVKSIVIGTRDTDPYSKDLKPFQMTDNDWPKFQRVHPILTWTYYEIWCFLKIFRIPYCSLYDLGYTSLGGEDTTIPNPELKVDGSVYYPAYRLRDGSKERDGRIKRVR